MFRNILGVVGVTTSLMLASPAQAQWQSFTPDNDGSEFWDNLSNDGTRCNIGYVVTGVAGTDENPCRNQRPEGWLEYTGPAMTQFWGLPTFTQVGGALFVKIGAGIGGDIAGQNRDWGYWTGAARTRTSLNGLVNPVTQFNFASGQVWGFWVSTTDGNFRYSDTDGQFAKFSGADDNYVIGFEDVTVPGGDRDYQDMIASVTIVPEPASAALVLSGLAGLVGIASRRRRA